MEVLEEVGIRAHVCIRACRDDWMIVGHDGWSKYVIYNRSRRVVVKLYWNFESMQIMFKKECHQCTHIRYFCSQQLSTNKHL